MKLNVSGKLYEVVGYHVRRETSGSTWTRSRGSPRSTEPKVIVAGWSAYPRQLDFAAFRELADAVGAKLMVDMAHFAASSPRRAPHPVPLADVTTTTTHKTLCGPRSGMILCREELGTAIDKAIFPGQQGRPLST